MSLVSEKKIENQVGKFMWLETYRERNGAEGYVVSRTGEGRYWYYWIVKEVSDGYGKIVGEFDNKEEAVKFAKTYGS